MVVVKTHRQWTGQVGNPPKDLQVTLELPCANAEPPPDAACEEAMNRAVEAFLVTAPLKPGTAIASWFTPPT